ncbi:hypothetical protein VN97_g8008 [Penicillium thymicola]|uniref:Uncharacterized protein n=1 Tax=Penicillium thymicola TaxID=293382 RepID=A0AAI9TDY6_PENTH|nr:hypothetical protein VN97_g8008 [Penicillium thymicola]
MRLNWSTVIAAIGLVNNNRGCLSEGGETRIMFGRYIMRHYSLDKHWHGLKNNSPSLHGIADLTLATTK